MNVTVRPIARRLKGPQCQRGDCSVTADFRVLDVNTGACLVVYCSRHSDELLDFLSKNALRT